MTSFLNLPADEMENVPELDVLRTEEEVQLEITDINQGMDRNNNPYLMPRFKVANDPNVKTFTKYFGLPNSSMDEARKNSALRQLKYFCQAFEIDYSSEIDLDQVIGQQGWALLGVDENEDSEYGPQNYVKRFVVPGA